ncbi:hypothetical protein QQS21_009233 [Conoideocrella luteorostrata]|uniref:Zn(2)-C6 fungal-type domain-containing protein n=1 Tax=Conoideocrella luteorostrata TaxID=1105319 RepID=A0AAJ0FQL5_9HYPO|nr:hypothetical protein QQS21_009233 [Conoideocrella luteorostrata]
MADVISTGISTDDPPREAGYNRSACTECQRRKQKCNREWPCDRCQRRKIADECRYNYSNPTLEAPAHDLTEKLKRTHDDYANRGVPEGEDGGEDEEGSGFDALAIRLYDTLGVDHGVPEQPAPRQDYASADSSVQMQRVLKLLPQRQSMDTLMQSFLTDVNYHYYIIYPPMFLQDYHIWWDRLSQKRPLSLQYTCLLAIVCASALQHVEPASEKKFEGELGDSVDVVADKLHAAMRELASVMPIGHYHYLNVQRLLHSCYWYKAEAKFLEAWHVLGAAIFEGRELGYHKEPAPGSVTDFDLEMRRRLWCILDTWDWQISSGLSRPKLIDRADCNTKLPKLTLEGHSVSPLLHMKMQSRLTRQLASRFSAPKNIIAPSEVQEYKVIIEDWVDQFPPEYSFDNPDTSQDDKCPWLFSHRFYVYTMACLLILNPIRHYMVRKYRWDTPAEELKIREVGIWYSLKLLKTLRLWVEKVYNRDGRLHFIIFSIFDTAAMLCTSILKDTEHTIQNRPDILEVIGDAVDMLKKLNGISKTSKTSYDILERLVRRLPESVPRNDMEPQVKRPRVKVSSSPRLPATSTPKTPQASTPLLAHQGAANLQARMPAVTTTAVTSSQAQAPVPAMIPAAPVPAVPIPTTPLSVPMANTATPVNLGPRQFNYSSPEFTHQHPPQQAPPHASQHSSQRVPRSSSYMVTTNNNHTANTVNAVNAGPSGNQFSNDRHGWSTASESTPPSIDDQGMMSSFSTNSDNAGMNGGTYQQQQVADTGPEFNIENLTDAQLGELAPLWSWHSENLDFPNLPPPTGGPNGHQRQM